MQQQRGFTLIEIVLVLGLIGALTPIIGISVWHLTVRADRNTITITALTPLENAGRTVARDLPLAQSVNLAPGGSSNNLVLSWTDWTNSGQYDTYQRDTVSLTRYRITYAFSNAVLLRTQEVCAQWVQQTAQCSVAWSTTSLATVARNVESLLFTRDASPGYLFTLRVSSAPKGPGFPAESRTYQFYVPLLGSEEPL